MTYRLTTQVRAMAIRQKGALAAVSILLCGALSGIATAANDQLTMTFTYSVAEGTCTVDAQSQLDFGKVTDNTANFDAFSKNWTYIGQSPLVIQLKDCVGTSSSGTGTPAITVTGYTLPTTGSANRKKFLMMPATSVTGLGMVLSKANIKSLTNGSTTDLVTLTGNSTAVDIGAQGTAPAASTTVSFTAALACGDASDCTVTSVHPGSDQMTLTFSFAYH